MVSSCACAAAVVKDPLSLGKLDFCPGKSDDEKIMLFGYFHHGFKAVDWVTKNTVEHGTCTQNPLMTMSYAQWLVEVRQQRGGVGGAALVGGHSP